MKNNCCKHGGSCPYCDPGIEEFYQQKVKEAKRASIAHKAATGIDANFEDNLDAKDIWYEYCELKDQEKVDEQDVPDDVYLLVDSWNI